MSFRLFSDDLKEGDFLGAAQVFNGFGHSGTNISPQLAWSDPPPGTQSFVITMFDPDAPTGSGWWHWIVANIPGSCRALPRGSGSGQAALPPGVVQARNDFGTSAFGGAAPNPGPPHRYIFTINALKVDLIDVTPDSSGAMVGFVVNTHRVGSAQLTTRYGV